MRLFRFNTTVLALIFSIFIEALFFAAFKLFGAVHEFSDSKNFWVQSWYDFHWPSIIVTDHCAPVDYGNIWRRVIGLVIFFSIAMLEWWIVFYAGIWFVRRFNKKFA